MIAGMNSLLNTHNALKDLTWPCCINLVLLQYLYINKAVEAL